MWKRCRLYNHPLHSIDGKIETRDNKEFSRFTLLACSNPYSIIALATMEDKDRFQLRQQPQLSGSGPLECWLGRLSERKAMAD